MATQAAARQSRPRGSLGRNRSSTLFARVDESTKATYDAIADATGMSLALVLEEVAKHVEVDEHGRPVWWAQPTPQQEELPLKTA